MDHFEKSHLLRNSLRNLVRETGTSLEEVTFGPMVDKLCEEILAKIKEPRGITVRAKVKCHEIVICQGWDSKTQKMCEARRFKMQIVQGDSDENRLFAAVSGGTAVELQTINPLVFDQFKVNGEYYVDFIPSEV